MDFSLIKQAGMTQAEFGALVPGVVGRSTVNLWVNGKMKPNRYINSEVRGILTQIAQALRDKALPLPPGPELDTKARIDAIRSRLSLT